MWFDCAQSYEVRKFILVMSASATSVQFSMFFVFVLNHAREYDKYNYIYDKLYTYIMCVCVRVCVCVCVNSIPCANSATEYQTARADLWKLPTKKDGREKKITHNTNHAGERTALLGPSSLNWFSLLSHLANIYFSLARTMASCLRADYRPLARFPPKHPSVHGEKESLIVTG